MFVEIKEGQKAIAKESARHQFQEGEIVEFVEYGDSSIEENYYDYIFTNGKIKQYLEKHHFELMES